MAHRIPEADLTPESSPPQALPADLLQDEHDQLQTLCQRLEMAAAALIRLRDRLQAQASGCRCRDQDRQHGGAEVGSLDPDGGRR